MTFGSLFAGIGGFDLGFERCGMQCKWQVEIDDYATRILERHWPDVHRQRDIRQCGRHNLERVDCIIGGFPCQDISYAGKGAGLEGERSGLFFEAVRLVRELRPRAVVLENVAGLLTRGLDRVLGTLAEIGFDAEWHCIPAAAVGAPHIRDRVFVLAYCQSESIGTVNAEVAELPNGTGEGASDVANAKSHGRRQRKQVSGGSGKGVNSRQECGPRNGSTFLADAKVISSGSRLRQDARPGQPQAGSRAKSRNDGGDVSNANSNRGQTGISEQKQRQEWNSEKPVDCNSGWPIGSDWWQSEPAVGELVDGVSGGLVRFAGRVATGIPNRVNKLRCLGNAIVPQVAEVVGRILLDRLGGQADGR